MTKQQHIRKAIGEIHKDLKTLPFCCLSPLCNEQAISSHSQQKEGQLRVISEQDKVYCLNTNIYNAIKNGGISVRSTPIHDASCFPGYCSNHDRSIFSKIENKPLVSGKEDQAILLFLRSISYEYVSKLKALYFYQEIEKNIGELLDHEMLKYRKISVDAYRRIEGPYYFRQIFNIIDQENFDQFCTVWHELNYTLPLSLTTTICPWLESFQEKKTSFGTIQPLVSVSIIPEESKTHIVFSWLREHDGDASWIRDSLKTLQGLEDLLNLCLSETADCCFCPSFWKSINSESQMNIVQNMRHSFFHERDDNVKIIELA